MMLRHKDVPGLSHAGTLEKNRMPPSYSKKHFLSLLLILWFTSLACAWVRSDAQLVSGENGLSTRLPTLTRTPLPTLTPTSVSTPVAVAEEADSPVAQPEHALADTAAADANPSTEGVSAVEAGAEAAGENHVLEPALAPSEASTGAGSASNEPPAASSAETSSAQELATATNTPASPPTATTEPPTPTISPTATPTPIPTDTPVPTATPLPPGWVFSGVNVSPVQSGGNLLIYGEVTNNTGQAHDLYFITGTFYDEQGQERPDVFTADYWPIETIPQGGRVPFELTVLNTQSIGNFELGVDAAPSAETPAQDFEFLEINPVNDEGNYCLTGKLRNRGGELGIYLTVIAVLFDDQDKVINFSDHYNYSPQNVVGDQTTDFEVCVDPQDRIVARHELRAWGL